ncbi:MAG: 2-oxoglutarate and iron-dependent oxygenase domain-containing protein, partial [Candidatus Binatia bacterium]
MTTDQPTRTASGVPVIDISGLFEDAAARLKVARGIGAACARIGFFSITGHGVDPSLIEGVRRVARTFFRLPVDQKALIARNPPRFRGYVGMGTEGLGRISGYGLADLKEAFSMGPVDFPDQPYFTNAEGAAHFEPNRWPARPADFRAVMEDYYRTMTALAARLMGGFALALDLPEDWFADKIDRPIS